MGQEQQSGLNETSPGQISDIVVGYKLSDRLHNRFLDPDPQMLLTSESSQGEKTNPKFHRLNLAIAQMVGGDVSPECKVLTLI